MTTEMKELEKELFYALQAEFDVMALYYTLEELVKGYRTDIGDLLAEDEYPFTFCEDVEKVLDEIEELAEVEYDAEHPTAPPKCPHCGATRPT